MKEKNNTNKIINKLKQFSLSLHSTTGFYDILYQTCKAAVEIFKVDHSGFAVFDQDYSFLTIASEYPATGSYKTIKSIIQVTDSQAELKLIQNKLINVYNLKYDNEFGPVIKERLLGYGIQSILIIPICVNKKVVASFSLDSILKKKKFTIEEISLCQILAGYTSIAMRISKSVNEPPSDPLSIKNFININIDANRNYGLCIIDKNFKVISTNNYYKERFGKDIVNKFCFEYIKNFKKPCSWCPHKNVIKEKNIATAISPTPQKGDPSKLLHSQLLSFPYKFDKNGEVEFILEILVEFSDKNLRIAENKRLLYINHQKLTYLLRRANENLIPYILGYYLIFEDYFNFDNVTIYFLDNNKYSPETQVNKTLIYNKNNTTQELNNVFRVLLNDNSLKDFDQITGRIQAHASLFDTMEHYSRDIHKYSKIFMSREPQRISSNEVGVIVPISYIKNLLITVWVAEENAFLTDAQFTAFSFFIPFIKEIIQTKIQISNLNVATENLKNRIDEININKNILIHAAPFVVGKVHDISFIYTKIMEEVNTLRYTSWDVLDSSKRNEKLFCSTDKLQNYAANLNQILKTMKDIVTLCTPKNELIRLSDIVVELKELFKEKLFVKRKQKNNEKIEREPIEILINCPNEKNILGDPVLFSHIFQNLIQNSIVAFQSVQRKEKSISVQILQTDESIEIDFSDNACGIDPDILDNIWEMYYSTRVKGTGLGLFFVKTIIEVYGGKIFVKSNWGFGTSFQILIPIIKTSIE